MRVCFVSALMMTDFSDPELILDLYQKKSMEASLGILSLAAVLCDRGITPQVVNLNKLFYDFIKSNRNEKSSDLLTFIIQHIESLSFDILGLSSICSSYPLTIRIAREVKRLHPDVKIILGGPQATVVDIPTMKAFHFIDFVVRGEAEDTFPLLLEALSGTNFSSELEKLPGITYRKGNDIIRNPNAPPILDLDRLPLPAYYLDPIIKEYKTFHLEVGRGCPFNCTFCSTSGFFNRKFRLKSPPKMIEQMKLIKDIYGINSITLIHDNFTVNRKRVVELCEALMKCGEDFYWSCSSRTDHIDEELIALMTRAGCRAIFFGIETGSARLQKVINKRLNLSDAVRHIQYADQQGIHIATSLITAFPDETKEDLRDTVNFFMDMFRFNNVEPQLALLAPLAGTPIYSIYKDTLVLDYIYSDMSFQGWKQNSADLEMIQANPEIFPNFYSIPTSQMDRKYFKEVRDFFDAMDIWFHWLPLVLYQDSGDMLSIFDRWTIWRANKPMVILDSKGVEVPYYNHKQFCTDFIEFVLTCYNKEIATAKTVISAIVKIEKLFQTPDREPIPKQPEEPVIFSLTSYPYKPAGLHIAQLNIDYKELLQCLKNKKDLKRISVMDVAIAFIRINREETEIDVRLLSPLSEELLEMCDGSSTVSDIIYQFSLLKPNVDGISSEKMCFFGLTQLFKQGLIEVSSQPIKKTANSTSSAVKS